MSVITLEQVEKAQVILDFLKANPHLHDQQNWLRSSATPRNGMSDELSENHSTPERALVMSEALSCGTAGCFAGWLSMLEGKAVYFDEGYVSLPYVIKEDSAQPIEEWAEETLGLVGTSTRDGIVAMFREENTIDDLSAWVDAMRESYRTGEDLRDIALDQGLLDEGYDDDDEDD